MSIEESGFLKMIFSTESRRNIPTPMPTAKISAVPFITAETCSASTERSGSATVIRRPIRKATERRSLMLLDFVRPAPICSPIGVIARSAPRLNIPIPRIRKRAQTRKTTSSVTLKETSGVKFKITTMRATGRTEMRASLNFFRRTTTNSASPYPFAIVERRKSAARTMSRTGSSPTSRSMVRNP